MIDPMGQYAEDAVVTTLVDDLLQQLERRRVTPLQVFRDDHHGALGSQRDGPLGQGVEPPAPAQLRSFVREFVRGAHAEDVGHVGDHRRCAVAERGQDLLQPCTAFVERITIEGTDRAFEKVDDRLQWAAGGQLRTMELEPHVVSVEQLLVDGLNEPRLADARLTRHDDGLTLAGVDVLETFAYDAELLGAADERCGRLHGRSRAEQFASDHLPDVDRLADSLQRRGPSISQPESSLEQTASRVADDHRARTRLRFEARRDVRCAPEHRCVESLGAPIAPTIVGPVWIPTRAASCTPRVVAELRVEPFKPLDDGETCAHGTFCIVLVCRRVSEVGEQPVAEVLADEAAETGDHFVTHLLVGEDQFAGLFRVEDLRQGRGLDQVAEHHREKPAFPTVGVVHDDLRSAIGNGRWHPSQRRTAR